MAKDKTARIAIVKLSGVITHINKELRSLNNKLWSIQRAENQTVRIMKVQAANTDKIATLIDTMADRIIDLEARVNQAEDAGRI